LNEYYAKHPIGHDDRIWPLNYLSPLYSYGLL
jgi:hypothetical protein